MEPEEDMEGDSHVRLRRSLGGSRGVLEGAGSFEKGGKMVALNARFSNTDFTIADPNGMERMQGWKGEIGNDFDNGGEDGRSSVTNRAVEVWCGVKIHISERNTTRRENISNIFKEDMGRVEFIEFAGAGRSNKEGGFLTKPDDIGEDDRRFLSG
jgi:hypothetical protein